MSKRMHPMMIASSLVKFVKEWFFVLIILFVINIGSTSTWVIIGRYIIIGILILSLLTTIVRWWRTHYEVKDSSIVIKEGAFVLKQRHLPFDRIQNVQTNTPVYFRFMNVTSLKLETGSGSDDASFTFPALTISEADRIEHIIENYRKTDSTAEISEKEMEEPEAQTESNNPVLENSHTQRTVHFTPTRKDVLKASILSASYIILVPVLLTFFQQLDSFFDITELAEDGFYFITNSWILLSTVITLLVIASVIVGMVHTYLKYGKFEIASDEERIYISQGVLNEKHFSIRKKNVQAVELKQSLLKRILGITSVRLISAGETNLSGDSVSSLYPFLPTTRAISLVEELLPGFQITTDMQSLPRKSFVARLLHIPWFWIIATAFILFRIPEWWWLSIILLILTLIARYLDYRFARFGINGSFIQLQTGGWEITTLVTKRKKAIEFNLEENIIQRRMGLVTMETKNRGKPVFVKSLADIPASMAQEAFRWYMRKNS